jgi:hypothetical protein
MFSARDTQIVQPTRGNHDLVGEAFGEIAQDIFHDAIDLHACQCMFAANADPGQPLIRPFLVCGQFTAAWLFFG